MKQENQDTVIAMGINKELRDVILAIIEKSRSVEQLSSALLSLGKMLSETIKENNKINNL